MELFWAGSASHSWILTPEASIIWLQLIFVNPMGEVMEKLQRANKIHEFLGVGSLYLTIGEAVISLSPFIKESAWDKLEHEVLSNTMHPRALQFELLWADEFVMLTYCISQIFHRTCNFFMWVALMFSATKSLLCFFTSIHKMKPFCYNTNLLLVSKLGFWIVQCKSIPNMS